MGNNPSRPHPTGGISTTAATSTPHGTNLAGLRAEGVPSITASTITQKSLREPRRRDSIQAGWKATAVPPSESRESATTAHQSTSTPSSGSSAPRSAQSLPVRPRSRTIEHLHSDPHSASAETTNTMGNAQSRQDAGHAFDTRPFNPSQPVNVPASIEISSQENKAPTTGAPPEQYFTPAQPSMNRPPRLPLPIEQEDYLPGSPIISPADLTTLETGLDLELEHGLDPNLPRRTSMLSSTTVDDDDFGEDLHAYSVDGEMRKTIPTLVEWRQPGEKVYVTGTFASWNRKFRLHKDDDHLSAIIQLPPGTHHLKFIVDGDMRTSDHMPTAVDYTNILVNYLEVSADPPAPTTPAAAKSHDAPASTGAGAPLPPTESTTQPTATTAATTTPATPARPKLWTSTIPQYLVDLDQPEDSAAYQRAATAIGSLPPPPSLPLFLNKSILNGNTPMKDDSSVLSMPNHTVLNHLATSSIRSGVLATSATTRYRKKAVTTILYKMTSGEEDD